MRIFQLARTPPQWLRVALASLMLAFALNSIAYATHHHEVTAGQALHGLSCGHCISFDHLTPAPATQSLALQDALADELALRAPAEVVLSATRVTSQPRAPPLLV